MITIEKDNKKILATEKAFEVLYKDRGYKKVEDVTVKVEVKEDIKEEEDTIPLAKRTAEELRIIAKEREVRGYYRMNKDELLKELE